MATGNTYDLSTPPSSFSLAHDLRSGNTYENERHQMIWSWQMILDLEDAPLVSVELMTMASTQMGMSAFRWIFVQEDTNSEGHIHFPHHEKVGLQVPCNNDTISMSTYFWLYRIGF